MSSYKKIYCPCDDCQYSYSKNGQEMNTCNICEYKYLKDSWKNNIDKFVSYINRVANSDLGKSKSLEHIKKYVKGGTNE